MDNEELLSFINGITGADENAVKAALIRQASLAKPPRSLGKLEDISVRFAGVTGKVINDPKNCRVIVFAADNGVVEEGVALTPQSVTLSQAVNMTEHKTGMSSLAKYFGDSVQVVDVGINCGKTPEGLVDRKINKGTLNIRKGPAMTRGEALAAIKAGIDAAEDARRDGIDIVGVGEMGIGNTTTSAAVISVLTGTDPSLVTGRGSGLTDEAYELKKRVIMDAISVNAPDPNDIIGVLSSVGGFDLCAMTGAFLGCAKNRIPAVVDGVISIAAALCAVRLCPAVKDHLFLSHVSTEPGYSAAAKELGLSPYLMLEMRLGEGSGCPIAFEIIKAACAVMRCMATFEEASINDGYLDSIRSGK
ncbi:MAG: nicotinate-nucleotide--dimethylbenzimidazole phosphoribosyltransferase [Clostridia bacterium]|nr:nicotinate-nucleotide--dimethylbenzimidazole phosphoribosyltransferase [Clostridia bacterium]